MLHPQGIHESTYRSVCNFFGVLARKHSLFIEGMQLLHSRTEDVKNVKIDIIRGLFEQVDSHWPTHCSQSNESDVD